jgi:hypothetical protein
MQTVTTTAAATTAAELDDDNDDNNNNPFKKRITYDDSKAINKYLEQMENMRKNTYTLEQGPSCRCCPNLQKRRTASQLMI